MDMQEMEKGFQEIWKLFAETNRRFQESQTELDKQFREIGERFKETERQFKETDRQFKKTDKKFDKYFGKVKELDRNWGKLVESLVKPSVAEQFRKRNFPISGSGQRVERYYNGRLMEIDILLTDGDAVIAVEVKTTLSVSDVDEHIEKHLKPFKLFFPEYRGRKVLGAVAYIHLEENADRYAYKKGLFVLTFTSGDAVKIRNDAGFVPAEWGD
jgi:hypothetical protein